MRVLTYAAKKKELLKIIQKYIDKGQRCMDQLEADYEDNNGDAQTTYSFWDGFHNCAQNIYREVEKLGD